MSAHVLINPDCRDSKHGSCSGIGWDEDLEGYAPCPCNCHHTKD